MPDRPVQLSLDLPLLQAARTTTLDSPAGAAARQLALDLPAATSFSAEDFLVGSSNEHAYRLVLGWPAWPAPVMRLHGPAGSGKSHLAAIWSEEARAPIVPAAAVRLCSVPDLVTAPALVIEDLDRGPLDEAALFHLLNIARERGSSTLVTAAASLEACSLSTKDLLSRLRLAPAAQLEPPDDALLKAVLVKLFLDRQLVVDATVIDLLANRIERSLASAREVVAALDREALSRGRRVTRSMAAAIVGLPEPVVRNGR